jgi:hypothetical protein
MHAGVLPELRRLAASASRVEGDALARLGTTAVPAGQPACWRPLAQPPQRRREHLWDWMVEHLDGRPAGGR